jgi:hypothetical protein
MPRRVGPDGFVRETFCLPRAVARIKAQSFFEQYPKDAYMTQVEGSYPLADGTVVFTVRRLASAD